MRHYRDVPRVRVIFENDRDLELLKRMARGLAEIARKDAENVRGTSVEQIHRKTMARYLRFADRIKAVRSRPAPEPPRITSHRYAARAHGPRGKLTYDSAGALFAPLNCGVRGQVPNVALHQKARKAQAAGHHQPHLARPYVLRGRGHARPGRDTIQ